jgi:hypothetical protein
VSSAETWPTGAAGPPHGHLELAAIPAVRPLIVIVAVPRMAGEPAAPVVALRLTRYRRTRSDVGIHHAAEALCG